MAFFKWKGSWWSVSVNVPLLLILLTIVISILLPLLMR